MKFYISGTRGRSYNISNGDVFSFTKVKVRSIASHSFFISKPICIFEYFRCDYPKMSHIRSQIARFMGPTWGPPRSCRPQMGPMLAPWTLLSGMMDMLLVHVQNPLVIKSWSYRETNGRKDLSWLLIKLMMTSVDRVGSVPGYLLNVLGIDFSSLLNRLTNTRTFG